MDLLHVSRRGRRQAFTLIELLVVIAIMAILMGLLLSSVQKAREAANSAACRNNLYQISRAFVDHHTKYGFYPTGGTLVSAPNYYADSTGAYHPYIGSKQNAGWGFQILPFIDSENIWDPGLKSVAACAGPAVST